MTAIITGKPADPAPWCPLDWPFSGDNLVKILAERQQVRAAGTLWERVAESGVDRYGL